MPKSPNKKTNKKAPTKPEETTSAVEITEDQTVPSFEIDKDTSPDEDTTSVASSHASSSKKQAKGNGNGKAKASANTAAGSGLLNDPLLTEIRLEKELAALMKLTNKGADTAHLQLDLLMDMLTGLTKSTKPDFIKDRMIATFINFTLKSTSA